MHFRLQFEALLESFKGVITSMLIVFPEGFVKRNAPPLRKGKRMYNFK